MLSLLKKKWLQDTLFTLVLLGFLGASGVVIWHTEERHEKILTEKTAALTDRDRADAVKISARMRDAPNGSLIHFRDEPDVTPTGYAILQSFYDGKRARYMHACNGSIAHLIGLDYLLAMHDIDEVIVRDDKNPQPYNEALHACAEQIGSWHKPRH